MSGLYSEVVLKHLQGKMIEIYQGSLHVEHHYAEFDNQIKTIIYGKLIDAEGECLIVEVDTDGVKGFVFINTYNIHSITCPLEGGVSIEDAYIPSLQTHQKVRSREKRKVKRFTK